jgi:very-short-patch-repair endonuclease
VALADHPGAADEDRARGAAGQTGAAGPRPAREPLPPRRPLPRCPLSIDLAPRTLLDLAARYDQRALLKALAEAEFHHDTRPTDIQATLRRGHPGSANLRKALNHHTPGHGQARSQLERRFRALLIQHQIDLPLRNQPLGPWTIDCLWPDRGVAVELDGRQHERPNQADSDDDRDLWLRLHGYIARRYGERQVKGRPDDVIDDLEDAFAEAVKLGYTPS